MHHLNLIMLLLKLDEIRIMYIIHVVKNKQQKIILQAAYSHSFSSEKTTES